MKKYHKALFIPGDPSFVGCLVEWRTPVDFKDGYYWKPDFVQAGGNGWFYIGPLDRDVEKEFLWPKVMGEYRVVFSKNELLKQYFEAPQLQKVKGLLLSP